MIIETFSVNAHIHLFCLFLFLVWLYLCEIPFVELLSLVPVAIAFIVSSYPCPGSIAGTNPGSMHRSQDLAKSCDS